MKKLPLLVCGIIVFCSFNLNAQLTNNLVSYWKLDETSGSVLDAAGSNPGTVYGATANQTGKLVKCYSFDGTNDYISIPNSTSLNIQGNTITMSAWVYPTANKHSVIVSKLHNTGTHVPPYFQYTLQFYYVASPTPRIYPRFGLSIGGDFKIAANSTLAVTLNQWHHLVGVYNGSTMKLYLDGTEVASTAQTGNINGYNTPVYISEIGSLDGSEVFQGRIDEIGLWNRALSASEVTQLYNSGSGLAHPFGSVVHVTSVTVTPSPASVVPGGTVQLTATVLPENATNKAVTWTAMCNPAEFTVNSTGLVSALGPVGSTGTIGAFANDNGISGTTTVTIVSAPSIPTVTTNSVTSITQTAATSGGNITSDGGATITARGVCWSTSVNPTTSSSKTTDGSGTGSFMSSITGLTANQTYHVRAYATNSVGTAYGSDLTFVATVQTIDWQINGNNLYFNGNVGIGSVNSQLEKLDINGNLMLRNLSNSPNAGAYMHFTSFSDNYPGPKIRSALQHASTSDTRSMLILSSYWGGYKDELTLMNGMVGIGTYSPISTLHLRAQSGHTLLRIERSATNVEGGIGFATNNNTDFYLWNDENGSLQIIASGLTGEDDALPRIRIPKANKNIILGLSGGNVGIGTNSPAYKLDVLGTIRAREIVVDLNGADFVFEKDYKLMPLSELEQFVKDQKHLPEIVTAKEMESNGTELGELNTKLLQKIEELTLYIIMQEKAINELRQEMEKMKSK